MQYIIFADLRMQKEHFHGPEFDQTHKTSK